MLLFSITAAGAVLVAAIKYPCTSSVQVTSICFVFFFGIVKNISNI